METVSIFCHLSVYLLTFHNKMFRVESTSLSLYVLLVKCIFLNKRGPRMVSGIQGYSFIYLNTFENIEWNFNDIGIQRFLDF